MSTDLKVLDSEDYPGPRLLGVTFKDRRIVIKPSDPVHVIYHFPCADGFAAAMLAELAFPDCTLHPCNYGDRPPEIPDEAVLIILDFSFEREILDAYAARMQHLFVLDHHQTAEKQLAGAEYAHFDNERSGCCLAYELFFSHVWPTKVWGDTPMTRGLLAVEDRDLWRFKRDGTRRFAAALRALPWDFGQWHAAFDNFSATVQAGGWLLEFRERLCEQWAVHSGYVNLCGHIGVCVPHVLASCFSECSELMLERCPDAKFAATFYDYPNPTRPRTLQKRVWSLRSRSDFNVATQIAEKTVGGGGHAQSAGFNEFCPDDRPPWVAGAVFDCGDDQPAGLRFFRHLPTAHSIIDPPWLAQVEGQPMRYNFQLTDRTTTVGGHRIYRRHPDQEASKADVSGSPT